MEDMNADENRIYQEAAVLAEKKDIINKINSRICVNFKSHVMI